MSLPIWIRRLPHNLSTIRPFIRLAFDMTYWSLGVNVYFDAAPGDRDYLFHFDETGLCLFVGPVMVAVGLRDTPEENAWIP